MGDLNSFLRLMRTVRHVPLRALAWRVWARAVRFYFASPLFGLGRLARGDVAATEPVWVGVELLPGDAARGRELARGKLSFAGEMHEVAAGSFVWGAGKASALWVFNAHYHEWLADLRAAGLRAEALRWVGEWLVGFGSYHPVAWHPYPTSLRLVAWLTHGKWLLEGASEEMREAFYDALQRQAAYLAANCEWDLGGNHLLKNLKARVYASLALEGMRQDYSGAMAELLRQVQRQMLPDGGHDERTPLYQAQVVRDLVEVRAVLKKAGATGVGFLDKVCERGGVALATYLLPGVGLGLFNDSARMKVEEVQALVRLSGADEAVEFLPNTGYARLERGPTVVLMDGGPVGPDENPGHAHADMLSFELVRGGRAVIVNQGTFAYQHRLRNALRGTAAHSTVDVGGEDSAEVWAQFRVGRRPRQVSLAVKGMKGGEIVAEGFHDGYRHKGVWHARKIVLAGDGSRLRGEDTLALRAPWWKKVERERVTAHFHLAPEVQVRLVGETEAELRMGDKLLAKVKVSGGRLDVKDSLYCPNFGEMHPSRQLVMLASVGAKACKLDWEVLFNN